MSQASQTHASEVLAPSTAVRTAPYDCAWAVRKHHCRSHTSAEDLPHPLAPSPTPLERGNARSLPLSDNVGEGKGAGMG